MAFLSSDAMQIMMVEIAEGTTPEASSLAPLSEREQHFWTQHSAELVASQAEQSQVEWTQEMPDLSTYRPGFASEFTP